MSFYLTSYLTTNLRTIPAITEDNSPLQRLFNAVDPCDCNAIDKVLSNEKLSIECLLQALIKVQNQNKNALVRFMQMQETFLHILRVFAPADENMQHPNITLEITVRQKD